MNLKLFLFLTALFSLSLFSQTKIIEHTSHGGDASTFSLEKEDNFGLRSSDFDYRLDTVIKYNQTAVIEIYHKGKCMSCRLVDTTQNHPTFNDPHVSLDSMQRLFPQVVFVGFGKQKKSKKLQFKASLSSSVWNSETAVPDHGIKILLFLCISLFFMLAIGLWKNQQNKKV